MRPITKLGLSVAFASMLAAPFALAQEGGAPENDPAQMMQGQGMMGADGMPGMDDMQGMMGMMQQMGPMMEACTEMMHAMATQPETPAPAPLGG